MASAHRPSRTHNSASAGAATPRQHGFDYPFFYLTLTLSAVGLLILSSASMAIAYKDFGSLYYYTFRQLLLGGIGGFGLFFLFQRVPYRIWKRLALPLMIISFILLAMVFIPELSYSWGGARRWLRIGSFSVQPSEILKFSFLIYLASWLDARRKEVTSVSYGMIPFALMVSIIGVFVMMQPDMGTFLVILATAALLYSLGGGKFTQMFALFCFGAVICYFLIQLSPYRLERILVFLNPASDPKGSGYQINQALIAIGSGGFWGRGFGQGLQKYNYLPEPMGDSIFAIFAEETGFIGILLLITLYGAFLWRGLYIAKRAPDIFGRLLAAGMVSGILVQAFVNMAAISGLLPLTGIALPFVSYGGTSLMITLAMAGIVLNISRYSG